MKRQLSERLFVWLRVYDTDELYELSLQWLPLATIIVIVSNQQITKTA